MFQGKSRVELGDFPPCPGVSTDEVGAIRLLTKYDDPSLGMPDDERHKPVRDTLIERDQNVLNVLGRVSQWCRAYHERIGYVEPVPDPD